MKNSLLSAMQTKDSFTENGMVTNSLSSNLCVDLFFQIGAMRGAEKSRLINLFTKAFGENPLYAMRLLFWARDVRGGAGERQIFKDIISYLAVNRTETLGKNLHLISEFGRWDDLLSLVGTPLENQAFQLISDALNANNQLCAKWMPRPAGGSRESRKIANSLRKFMKLSPSEYRKLLVNNSNTVEQLMCANEWEKIDYSKLPSKAMSDLMKSFSRNDLTRFQEYLGKVEKGTAKINAGAIYPYDVIRNLNQGNTKGADLQWNALPNYMEGNTERVLPMVDVSGSMSTSSAGDSPSITCLDVAVSLGLYISERNDGPFKDAFITFTRIPSLQYLKGSLSERCNQIKGPVGYDTNLEEAFEMVLRKAVEFNVPADEIPTMIIVLSDMEFNCSEVVGFTAQEMVEDKYRKAGYEMPKLVYWNLHSRNDSNKPVKFDKYGTALVSGFSPSLLTNLLAGKEITPLSMMLSVIDSERYSKVTI